MVAYELVEQAISFIPIKDLYNLYIKDDSLANVYGNFETFVNDDFLKGLQKTVRNIRTEKDKENLYWIILCKKKLFYYIEDKIIYFIDYFRERKDLNLWLRLKISFIKSYRWVRRINFVIDIFQYSRNPNIYNDQIKYLFNTNQINGVYIYKLNKDSFMKYQFDLKYKK